MEFLCGMFDNDCFGTAQEHHLGFCTRIEVSMYSGVVSIYQAKMDKSSLVMPNIAWPYLQDEYHPGGSPTVTTTARLDLKLFGERVATNISNLSRQLIWGLAVDGNKNRYVEYPHEGERCVKLAITKDPERQNDFDVIVADRPCRSAFDQMRPCAARRFIFFLHITTIPLRRLTIYYHGSHAESLPVVVRHIFWLVCKQTSTEIRKLVSSEGSVRQNPSLGLDFIPLYRAQEHRPDAVIRKNFVLVPTRQNAGNVFHCQQVPTRKPEDLFSIQSDNSTSPTLSQLLKREAKLFARPDQRSDPTYFRSAKSQHPDLLAVAVSAIGGLPPPSSSDVDDDLAIFSSPKPRSGSTGFSLVKPTVRGYEMPPSNLLEDLAYSPSTQDGGSQENSGDEAPEDADNEEVSSSSQGNPSAAKSGDVNNNQTGKPNQPDKSKDGDKGAPDGSGPGGSSDPPDSTPSTEVPKQDVGLRCVWTFDTPDFTEFRPLYPFDPKDITHRPRCQENVFKPFPKGLNSMQVEALLRKACFLDLYEEKEAEIFKEFFKAAASIYENRHDALQAISPFCSVGQLVKMCDLLGTSFLEPKKTMLFFRDVIKLRTTHERNLRKEYIKKNPSGTDYFQRQQQAPAWFLAGLGQDPDNIRHYINVVEKEGLQNMTKRLSLNVTRLKELQDDCVASQQEKDKLTGEVTTEQGRLDSFKCQNSTLRKDVDALKAEHDDLVDKRDSLNEEIKGIVASKGALSLERDALVEQKTALLAELKKLREEKQDIQLAAPGALPPVLPEQTGEGAQSGSLNLIAPPVAFQTPQAIYLVKGSDDTGTVLKRSVATQKGEPLEDEERLLDYRELPEDSNSPRKGYKLAFPSGFRHDFSDADRFIAYTQEFMERNFRGRQNKEGVWEFDRVQVSEGFFRYITTEEDRDPNAFPKDISDPHEVSYEVVESGSGFDRDNPDLSGFSKKELGNLFAAFQLLPQGNEFLKSHFSYFFKDPITIQFDRASMSSLFDSAANPTRVVLASIEAPERLVPKSHSGKGKSTTKDSSDRRSTESRSSERRSTESLQTPDTSETSIKAKPRAKPAPKAPSKSKTSKTSLSSKSSHTSKSRRNPAISSLYITPNESDLSGPRSSRQSDIRSFVPVRRPNLPSLQQVLPFPSDRLFSTVSLHTGGDQSDVSECESTRLTRAGSRRQKEQDSATSIEGSADESQADDGASNVSGGSRKRNRSESGDNDDVRSPSRKLKRRKVKKSRKRPKLKDAVGKLLEGVSSDDDKDSTLVQEDEGSSGEDAGSSNDSVDFGQLNDTVFGSCTPSPVVLSKGPTSARSSGKTKEERTLAEATDETRAEQCLKDTQLGCDLQQRARDLSQFNLWKSGKTFDEVDDQAIVAGTVNIDLSADILEYLIPDKQEIKDIKTSMGLPWTLRSALAWTGRKCLSGKRRSPRDVSSLWPKVVDLLQESADKSKKETEFGKATYICPWPQPDAHDNDIPTNLVHLPFHFISRIHSTKAIGRVSIVCNEMKSKKKEYEQKCFCPYCPTTHGSVDGIASHIHRHWGFVFVCSYCPVFSLTKEPGDDVTIQQDPCFGRTGWEGFLPPAPSGRTLDIPKSFLSGEVAAYNSNGIHEFPSHNCVLYLWNKRMKVNSNDKSGKAVPEECYPTELAESVRNEAASHGRDEFYFMRALLFQCYDRLKHLIDLRNKKLADGLGKFHRGEKFVPKEDDLPNPLDAFDNPILNEGAAASSSST